MMGWILGNRRDDDPQSPPKIEITRELLPEILAIPREVAREIDATFILVLLFNNLRLQKATEENVLVGGGGVGGTDSGWISGEDLNTDGEESFGRKEAAAEQQRTLSGLSCVNLEAISSVKDAQNLSVLPRSICPSVRRRNILKETHCL